jgi:rhodanese-related sulfurtransferase
MDDEINDLDGTNSYMDVSAAEAKQLIEDNPDLIVIDVSPHYAAGHLPRAISYYPLSELQTAIPNLDSNAMYLVYCHADGPSRAGAQILVDEGFANVYRLESHFGGWQAAGYEIEK